MIIPFWVKLLALLALVGALIGGWHWREAVVEQRGYDRAVTERQAQDEAHRAAATAKSRKEERALQEVIHQQSVKREEEKVRYEKTIDTLRADARRGNSGLRAPGASACLPAGPAPASAAAAGGPVDPAGFKLVPETADSVLSAAADLKRGVQDRNALIDLYEQCRAIANSPDLQPQ